MLLRRSGCDISEKGLDFFDKVKTKYNQTLRARVASLSGPVLVNKVDIEIRQEGLICDI